MNNLYDFHLHSFHSYDSNEDPEKEIKEAIKNGLSGLCFTEHNDFGYVNEDNVPIFQLNYVEYFNHLLNLKKKYACDVEVLIGVEQGLTKEFAKEINAYPTDKNLDFIIGSTHVVDGIDPFYESYWEDKSVNAAIKRYFENIYESILVIDSFDVYGHLDYILRYIPDKSYLDKLDEILPFDLIIEILKELIRKNKGLEINTAGIRKSKHCNPSPPILKEYKNLGGEIITIGSDAHTFNRIGENLILAEEILKECGFKYKTIFKQRKPIFFKI